MLLCKYYLTLHQPARFFATAKTDKIENINGITIDKLCPIIEQTGHVITRQGKMKLL